MLLRLDSVIYASGQTLMALVVFFITSLLALIVESMGAFLKYLHSQLCSTLIFSYFLAQ